jgi:hypothetical protein
MTRTKIGVGLVALACILCVPPAALAQQTSAIAGVVRDTSGAVLPGVTVEAASPALIEKVRTVVTDDQGRYNIVDLRPGAYVMTFTLAGFNTFKRGRAHVGVHGGDQCGPASRLASGDGDGQR